jgi:hypothetical protein
MKKPSWQRFIKSLTLNELWNLSKGLGHKYQEELYTTLIDFDFDEIIFQ